MFHTQQTTPVDEKFQVGQIEKDGRFAVLVTVTADDREELQTSAVVDAAKLAAKRAGHEVRGLSEMPYPLLVSTENKQPKFQVQLRFIVDV